MYSGQRSAGYIAWRLICCPPNMFSSWHTNHMLWPNNDIHDKYQGSRLYLLHSCSQYGLPSYIKSVSRSFMQWGIQTCNVCSDIRSDSVSEDTRLQQISTFVVEICLFQPSLCFNAQRVVFITCFLPIGYFIYEKYLKELKVTRTQEAFCALLCWISLDSVVYWSKFGGNPLHWRKCLSL